MRAVEGFILFWFLVGLGACLDTDLAEVEEASTGVRFAQVDQRLWPHFAAFEQEAKARGYAVDLSTARITGAIVDINEGNVAGQCSYGGHTDHEVTIDQDFWDRSTHLYREYIVFHELGHCYLGRGHREGCRADRTFLSMMRSGVEQSCRDFYTAATRGYYVDELFAGERP